MSGTITRLENGFDTATVNLADTASSLYPATVTTGTAIQVDVKDVGESTYPTNPLFKGVVRFPVLPYSPEIVTLKCDGAGYGFGDTVCAQEYGSQSHYTTTVDTASEILTEASHGIITKWVNKIMESATGSGFAYTTSIDANLTDTIQFISFPYKPCNKCVDDLCDLLTAIRTEAANKGPHWIVTTDDVFRMKELNSDDANWHKYYNSTAISDDGKLYQGIDFTEYSFEKIGPEANYVIYYGAWRRPSNGDAWTENNFGSWTGINANITSDSDAADHKVNSYSILCTATHAVNIPQAVYPSTLNWAIDLSDTNFKEYNVPYLNVWLKRSAGSCVIDLVDTAAKTFRHSAYNSATGAGVMQDANRWYHISVPVGDYANEEEEVWDDVDGASWNEIDYVSIWGGAGVGNTMHIDGLHFGGAVVCRVARKPLATITTQKLKVKVITDDVGKDDTLKAGTITVTDTGLMARMAYAELLRCQTTSLVGTVKIPMIKDLLPGQMFKIYAKKTVGGTYNINGTDMRVTKITHDLNKSSCTSTLSLTDDVSNSHPRGFYEDWNTVLAHAARPEFQDRQASSMKAGEMEIRVVRLEEEY